MDQLFRVVIPVISPGLIQLRKGFLVSKRKMFWQGSVILASVVWVHGNNCCKGAVTILYQEGFTTGITFCHQTGGPITGWAYSAEGLITGILQWADGKFKWEKKIIWLVQGEIVLLRYLAQEWFVMKVDKLFITHPRVQLKNGTPWSWNICLCEPTLFKKQFFTLSLYKLKTRNKQVF